MKKILNSLMIALILLSTFMPLYHPKAASAYSVEMVTGSSANKVVGTYSSYSEALNAMNAQNSTSTEVATIYKDGIPIDSKYAIFKFKPGGVYSLYRNSNSSSAYTSVSGSYGIDAALLGYSENGRVKVMISGFTGWTDINNGVITPISLIGGNIIVVSGTDISLRSSASIYGYRITYISGDFTFNYTETAQNNGYTWYKINYNGEDCWIAGGDWVTRVDNSLGTYYNHYSPTGNLIHHFTTYTGTSYSDNSFTNLGTAPSYLVPDAIYYSFDGNYFYSSLTKMLEDYRNGNYNNSVNKDSPYYSYYMYLTSRSKTAYTAEDLDSIVANKGYNASTSKLYGTGAYFIEAQEKYGSNALLAFSAAINESKWGTSQIAMDKNNLFGYGAADSCPYDCAVPYSSPRDSILDYAQKTGANYNVTTGKYYYGSHYGNKSSGKNVKYATDPYWGEKMAGNAFLQDIDFGSKDFESSTIGVSKKNVTGVWVYDKPELTSAAHIYTMKNPNSWDNVYDFSATIVDKVTNEEGREFYKIYTDLPSEDNMLYGYVWADEWNVSNSQPIINAEDKTINVGTDFNYLEGVTATDKEDGSLTSRITYTGTVDTTKEGSNKVTYTVTDNNNFSVSKTINVEVIGNSTPVIDASDKEVTQFTEFNYLDGVTATDPVEGNITNRVTYTETVDTSVVDTYEVTYTVTNSKGESTSKTITVTVIPNEKPVIEAQDKTIYLNSDFDPKEGVTATDKEDGPLTESIVVEENNVKPNVIGEYTVTYSVTDSALQKTTKTITINVVEKVLKEADGLFYIDYLNNVDGKLQLKGYNTIQGINNDLNIDIKYNVTFKNIDTNQEFTQTATRITNDSEIPFDVYSLDGKNYKYSWFTIDLDIDSLPNGNYITYITSTSDDYYSQNVINNKTNSKEITSFSSDKNAVIRNNYNYDNSPIEFIIRDEKLAEKTVDSYYNQFDNFTELNFTDNNLLHIRGMSYSYGMNLSENSSVDRKIIFENQEDYKTYIKDLGSVTTGDYEAPLPESDNLSKTRAWYDNNIDISDIPVGKYTIYITTSSNVTDISELTEKLGRELNGITAEINGKTYSFNINFAKNSSVELIVK